MHILQNININNTDRWTMISSKNLKRHSKLVLLVVIAIFIFVTLIHIFFQINHIQEKIAGQEVKYNDLSSKVSAVKYSPGTLSECINAATLEYSNFIKTNGTISQTPGKELAYSLPEHEWKKADAKLKSDRTACESQFGK